MFYVYVALDTNDKLTIIYKYPINRNMGLSSAFVFVNASSDKGNIRLSDGLGRISYY
ncbi:MAG: hypothetical protein PHS15_03890 [Clostridiaceae bacterium]|nr:hypothetical protein [Clostridiaceae bacterium]